MQKKQQVASSGRVLARVLADDLSKVQAGEAGWSVVIVQNPDGSIWGMSNRDWDHD